MKFILLSLDTYVNTNQNFAIDAFAKLGISKLSLLYHWIDLPGYWGKKLNAFRNGPSLLTLIDEFNQGLLSPTVFKNYLKNKFPILNSKSDKEIDAAWNAMCQVTDFTREAFDEATKLHSEENDTFVVFHSNTNLLQRNNIEKQYNNKIPGEPLFSFDYKTTGIDLLKNYVENLKSKKILPEDILVVYSPPPAMPYPKLGLLSWVFDPLGSWTAYQEQSFVTQLQNLSKNNFTLVPTKATPTQPKIFDSVKDFMEKPESTLESQIKNKIETKSESKQKSKPEPETEKVDSLLTKNKDYRPSKKLTQASNTPRKEEDNVEQKNTKKSPEMRQRRNSTNFSSSK